MTNHHNIHGLKQHWAYILQFFKWEVQYGLHWMKVKVSTCCLSSGGPRDKFVSCSLELLTEFSSLQLQDRDPWDFSGYELRAIASFRRPLHSLALQGQQELVNCISPEVFLAFSACPFLKTHMFDWAHLIIQNGLPLFWSADQQPHPATLISFCHVTSCVHRSWGLGCGHLWGAIILTTTGYLQQTNMTF